MPPIAEIHVNTWKEAYEGMLPEADLNAVSVDKAPEVQWSEAIEFNDPQVQVVGGRRPHGGLSSPSTGPATRSPKPTTGEIWALYVLPRRLGPGRRPGPVGRRATRL
jgi:hypothetical protein